MSARLIIRFDIIRSDITSLGVLVNYLAYMYHNLSRSSVLEGVNGVKCPVILLVCFSPYFQDTCIDF